MGNAMDPSTVDVYVGDLLFFELRYTHHEAENRQFDCMASVTFKIVLAFGLTHADFSCHWHWSLRDEHTQEDWWCTRTDACHDMYTSS